jgi:hypothetical protein
MLFPSFFAVPRPLGGILLSTSTIDRGTTNDFDFGGSCFCGGNMHIVMSDSHNGLMTCVSLQAINTVLVIPLCSSWGDRATPIKATGNIKKDVVTDVDDF